MKIIILLNSRYADILNLGVKKSQHADADTHAHNRAMQLQLLFHYQSDVCLLRLFESFLESAPQLLLQLYVMHELDSWHPWTGMANHYFRKGYCDCCGLSLTEFSFHQVFLHWVLYSHLLGV